MILQQKEHLDPKLKEDLKQYVYDILGYIMEVYKGLPCGLPEYVYQEAFAKKLRKNGIDPHILRPLRQAQGPKAVGELVEPQEPV